jgi:hypothetical protein
LRRLGYGQSIGGIAEALNLSVKTVSTYRARILEKLNLPHTAALIRYAIVNGLSPDPKPPLDERAKLEVGGDDNLGH